MNTDAFKSQKKFSNEEIGSAITFLKEIEGKTDEELRTRDLKIGEVQKINHFLMAVRYRESTLLPKQAATLLRLTPILLPRGSNTVHNVILTATPTVVDAYGKATDLTEKRLFADAIKTAGVICMDKGLGPTTRENRLWEFKIFEPFIGQTRLYREAQARYNRRGAIRASDRLISDVGKEAPVAHSSNPFGMSVRHRLSNEYS